MTTEDLIRELNSNPTTEKEIGYNNAIIKILKESTLKSDPRELLKKAFDKTGNLSLFHTIDYPDIINKLNTSKTSGSKPQAVRDLKEYVELGLKDTKDIADIFFELN